ncbi:MAG: hypothetical protein WA142_05865 [Rugosibacter sp.]
MKLLRLLLVFMLSLAIPFAASSAVVMEMTMSHCPMQGENNTSMSAMSAEHDCCDTEKSAPSKSHAPNPCKSGQTCKICSVPYLSFTSAVRLPSLPPIGQLFVAQRDTSIPTHDPSGLWRPPRFL